MSSPGVILLCDFVQAKDATPGKGFSGFLDYQDRPEAFSLVKTFESTYAVHHGYNTNGSEQIRELTSSEARQWVEDKLTTEEYEKEFGELNDAASDERRPLLLKLQASTFELLRKQKADTGMSYVDLVEQAIIELYKV